jgi:hypothetical protein
MRMSFLIMDKNKYFLVESLRRNSLQNNLISVPQEIRGTINKKSVKKKITIYSRFYVITFSFFPSVSLPLQQTQILVNFVINLSEERNF